MLKTILNTFFADKGDVRSRPARAHSKSSFYQFSLPALNGKEVIDFSRYRGRPVVLINVASRCGFTPQYADWQRFHEKHGERVTVLGFPANNFLWQESGSNEEIASFCQLNYGVTFQLFEKIDVIGLHQHPLYRWLSHSGENGWNDQAPTWNFCKYLVDETGELTHFFGSRITPDHPAFRKATGG